MNNSSKIRGANFNNKGLRLAMINFGPGEIELFILNKEYMFKLANLLNISIFEFAQDWIFIEWLVTNNVEFTYTSIKKNEIVFIPPFSLYFSKSENNSTSLIYEFGFKDLEHIKNMYEMYELRIQHKQKCQIKIHTLLLDICNIDMLSLTIDKNFLLFIQEKLHYIIKNEENLVENISSKLKNLPYVLPEPDGVNTKFCEECFQEIFNYFGLCKICDFSNNGLIPFKCLKCIINHLTLKKCKNISLYAKYNKNSLNFLLIRMERVIRSDPNDSGMLEVQNELTENYKMFQPKNNLNLINDSIIQTNSKDIFVNQSLFPNNLNNLSYQNSIFPFKRINSYTNMSFSNNNLNIENDLMRDANNSFDYSKDEDILKLRRTANDNDFLLPKPSSFTLEEDFMEFN